MPIRIISVKRVAFRESCIGCGKVGTFLCAHCKKFHDATKARVQKLWGTVEHRFASLRF